MKNLALITFLFSPHLYIEAMYSPVSSLPRTHLIPLDEEHDSFKSFMGSPPRGSRSSHHGNAKELQYLDFDDCSRTTKNIYEIKQKITNIKAKMNEDIALILPLENLPAQANESLQWHLSKGPLKLTQIGNAFGPSDTQSQDFISFIFLGKTKGFEEILFSKETIDGDTETRVINIEIE